MTETGYQALSYRDMAGFADDVLRLDEDQRGFFFRVIEETDNAVLYDHYTKAKADAEASKKEMDKRPKGPKRVRRK